MAVVWAGLILAFVSALLQLWPVLVFLLLVAGGYWVQIRRTDKRNAWNLPLRQASLGSDIARVIADALLKIAMLVVMAIVAISSLGNILASDTSTTKMFGWIALGGAVLSLVALIVLGWKRSFLSWRVLGFASLIIVPAFCYLVWDDAEFAHPLTPAQLNPTPAQADASWRTTLWYATHDGPPATRHFSQPGILVGLPSVDPENYAGRLEKFREQVHAAWSALAPEREWLAALDAFQEIGDLSPARWGDGAMNDRPFKALVQTGCAEAGLLALDGHSDDAIAVLLPILKVSRKLEASARTPNRCYTARFGLGQTVAVSRFVLAHTSVSSEKRAALAAALDGGPGGAGGIRQILWIDYAWNYQEYYALGLAGSIPPDWGKPMAIAAMLRPFYLVRATANAYAQYIGSLADLATQRELKKFATFEREFAGHWPARLKNPGGAMMFLTMRPIYTKLVETYWKTEDARLALLAELRNAPPAAAK